MNNLVIPGFTYELIDQSQSPTIPVTEQAQPLFLAAASADKGPEEMRVVSAENFFKLYGEDKNYYIKHGQPLLQVANLVNNGAKVLFKRVVAEDATLANLTVVGKAIADSVQKTDSEGNLLYIDPITGQETTEVGEGNEPVMETSCKIKYEIVHTENVKNLQTIITEVENTYEEEENSFPLFTIVDNGRGLSNKKIRISPDYNTSKYATYMKYNFEIIENNKVIETIPFCLDPDIVEANVNRSLQNVLKMYSNQLKCKLYEDQVLDFIAKVAEISGNDVSYCRNNDILFAKERKNVNMKNIKIDLSEDLSNLSYVYGIALKEGSNGNFGEAPFGTTEYTEQLVKFFSGEFDDGIYDLDNYKIDLLVDANYPAEVKREIEKLVIFREDLYYFRDLGIGLRTLDDILAADADSVKNKFCASYLLSYDVIDPFTRKQIPVTVGYTLSRLLVNHFLNGRTRPVAGELYNMVLTDAIEGTVNFIPKVTPAFNQKETLIEARINYATYIDNKLVLETLMTSQEEPTQLSYIHNVLAVQEIIKAIRTRCPKTRYSFLDGEDLITYKDDVNLVLRKYVSNFRSLKLVYLQDPTMVANNIFYAAIEVTFRNFVQAEHFKIYALA